jgi:AcrR family transcriptional regulator
MSDMLDTDRPMGLRERKKAKTRAAIRRHALRLFREQGYPATTVEQIAEAAEVSPATFYRYFPTKEDVILQDDFDVLAMDLFEAQPPDLSPIAAMRATVGQMLAAMRPEDIERFRETTSLTMTIPEVRARALDEFTRTIQVMAEVVARRAGLPPDNFAVRNVAGAITGVIMSSLLPLTGEPTDMFATIDAALAHLEAGLPL